jgi:hypothetical protein
MADWEPSIKQTIIANAVGEGPVEAVEEEPPIELVLEWPLPSGHFAISDRSRTYLLWREDAELLADALQRALASWPERK